VILPEVERDGDAEKVKELIRVSRFDEIGNEVVELIL
jgi:hypothetical protein